MAEIPAETVERAAIALYFAPHRQDEWYPTIPEAAREVCRMRARSVLAEAAPLLVQAGREAAAADIRAEIEKMTKAAHEKPLGPDADDYAAIGNLAYAALVAESGHPVARGDNQEPTT